MTGVRFLPPTANLCISTNDMHNACIMQAKTIYYIDESD